MTFYRSDPELVEVFTCSAVLMKDWIGAADPALKETQPERGAGMFLIRPITYFGLDLIHRSFTELSI